jgi:hypothetical protein
MGFRGDEGIEPLEQTLRRDKRRFAGDLTQETRSVSLGAQKPCQLNCTQGTAETVPFQGNGFFSKP